MPTNYEVNLSSIGRESGITFTWINQPTDLQVGDTITLTAAFGDYQDSKITEYQGLSVGAECYSTNDTTLGTVETNLEGKLKLTYDSTKPNRFYTGKLKNITKEVAPGDKDIFTSVLTAKKLVTRGGEARDITHQVVMTYNPSSTILKYLNAEDSTYSICLAADYGDPHKGGCNIPVKRKKK